MTRPIKDLARSVHTRLLTLAKQTGRPFTEVLQLYAMERFLYQRDTSIAEKFHAMVVLGTLNGRMKDFYDIWLLAQNFEFEGGQLSQAIKATFGTRTTVLESDPVALTPAFAESAEAQKRWAAFLKKSALTDAPPSFAEVVLVIRRFLLPVSSPRTPDRWRRGGPWS